MAVNNFPFVLNFKSVDGKKYRKYISGELIPGGLIVVSENENSYQFDNTDVFKSEVNITAFEIDITKETSPIVQESLNKYKLTTTYNSERDSEILNIVSQFGTLSSSEIKNISANRSYDLNFTTPISDENFLQFPEIGQITPILNLSGTNTTDSGVLNTDGTININYVWNFNLSGVELQPIVTNTFISAVPIITNPDVTNLTDTTATIRWVTNYPSDAQVLFLNEICPHVPSKSDPNILVSECQTETIPSAANYSAENLKTEHSIDVSFLKPSTKYTIKLQSKFPVGVNSEIKDVVFTYPTDITFTTQPEQPPLPTNPLDDILFFEVLFAGNQKDSPEMYYDTNRIEPRVSLKFDYNQPVTQLIGEETTTIRGTTRNIKVNITQPILNQTIRLFNNTDKLSASKTFIGSTPSVDLGFVINEDFENDLQGNPFFIRDSIYYTLDIEDSDLIDGNISITESDIFSDSNPTGKWKPVILDDNNGFIIQAEELLTLKSGEIGNRIAIASLYKKRIEYTPKITILDTDGLLFEVPFSERNLERIIEIPYDGLEFANGVEVYVGERVPRIIRLTNTTGLISLSYEKDFGLTTGEKVVQISAVYIENGEVKNRAASGVFNINIVPVDDFPNLLTIYAPKRIDIPANKNYDTNYDIKLTATEETSYVDVELVIKDKQGGPFFGKELQRVKLKTLLPLPRPAVQTYSITRSLNWIVWVTDTSKLEEGMSVEIVSGPGKLPEGTTIYRIDSNMMISLSLDPIEPLSTSTVLRFTPNTKDNIVKFSAQINIQNDIQKKFPLWDNRWVNIELIPYSTKKISDPLFSNVNAVRGLTYPIITYVAKSQISITLPQAKNVILDTLLSAIKIKSPKENKYISHLANFGNDSQTLISSWENDNYTLSDKTIDEAGNEVITKEVKSVILKLYNPLPDSITTNSTLWITKLLANPIVETVVLQDDVKTTCPPLRGPNFKIPVNYITGQSTAYQSLDTLIISSSVSSSASLIQEYLSKGAIDDSQLNVQYASGSITEDTAVYLWNNFVHFSSAKERLANFVYKVQLIELYENAISSSNYDPTSTGYTNSFTVKRDVELQTEKKNKIIGGFDGFEKFLYQYSSDYTTNDSTSITWPYNAGVRMVSTSNTVSDWYDNVIVLAEEFDKENKNALVQNIPSYILNNEENDQLLLFINMIGQHFDLIYYFNKAIERSRGANYSSKNGIANKLLYDKLKSFNWDAKNLAANSQLWEYLLGLDTDGNTKNTKAAKDRNNEIWRRILNNLPYLLKHKGTKRAVHALLACYGIPSSNLSILEFGGPEPTGTTKSKYLIENISNTIKLEISSKVSTLWTNTALNRKPETVEIFVKPAYASNWTVVSGSGWSLTASGSADSKYGRVFFKIGANNYLSSSVLPIFNNEYFGVSLTTITGSTNYTFGLDVAQYKGERQIFASSTTTSVAAATAAPWQTAGQVAIGSGFSGSVDEFRLWSTALDTDIFYEHVAFPEMVNGNHVSSSTQDLFFRLDFEYPKNVNTYTTTPNVDNNIYYSQSLSRNDIETTTIINGVNIFSEITPAIYSASFSGFTSVTSYPYQFEVIERNSALEMPDLGIQRYSTNKIRFENQSLENNVLYKDQRNTTRAFDNAPMDSNKLGLFFSPTKELNIDIAKSFGGLNLDDYIGDPRDQYNDRYVSLDRLREYYFNRFNGRDIYAYINLVKMYEQNLFEDIKQLLPARAKVTTGILIEPHILERSKIARKKPSGENNQYETSIEYNLQENVSGETSQYETTIDNRDTTQLISEATQYEGDISTEKIFNLESEATQYEGTISTEDFSNVEGEATQYEGDIDTKAKDASIQSYVEWLTQTIGASTLEDYGLGLFMQEPGVAVRSYIDEYGFVKKERVRVNLLTRQYRKFYEKYKTRLPNGLADFRDGTEVTSSLVNERILTIQPFAGTTNPTVNGEIVEVTPVYGYLPTHYKYTQDVSTGLQNSFYKGCKLSGIVAIDGKPVVEEFIGNPGTLKVNKFGRDSNEPILEVE